MFLCWFNSQRDIDEKKKIIQGFYYRLVLPYDDHRSAEQMWIICCIYNHVTSASGSTTLEGYGDVGVSLSFIAAPDNWLRSLERCWLTLLAGEKEDGGMTVRMRLSERRGKEGGERLQSCVCALIHSHVLCFWVHVWVKHSDGTPWGK